MHGMNEPSDEIGDYGIHEENKKRNVKNELNLKGMNTQFDCRLKQEMLEHRSILLHICMRNISPFT